MIDKLKEIRERIVMDMFGEGLFDIINAIQLETLKLGRDEERERINKEIKRREKKEYLSPKDIYEIIIQLK